MTAALILIVIAAAAGLVRDHIAHERRLREARRRQARLGRLWRGTYDLVDQTGTERPGRVRS